MVIAQATYCDATCAYHDEARDGFRATVTRLPEAGPVVSLAEQPALLLKVPVGENGATLTTPGRARFTGHRSQSARAVVVTNIQQHRLKKAHVLLHWITSA